jgi:hypothetical protein
MADLDHWARGDDAGLSNWVDVHEDEVAVINGKQARRENENW